jgi:cell fate (sporulation/competence/biofilm development) regulator YlbF (YheA/YmcA/DUF963 family)
MNEIDLQQGQQAIEELETNASKLSNAVRKITEFESVLNNLSELHKTSSVQLEKYQSNFSQLKSEIQIVHQNGLIEVEKNLTTAITVKLGEGLVELSTRIKDLSEEIRNTQIKIVAVEEESRLLNELFVKSEIKRKSSTRFSLLTHMIITLGIGVLIVQSFGFIS